MVFPRHARVAEEPLPSPNLHIWHIPHIVELGGLLVAGERDKFFYQALPIAELMLSGAAPFGGFPFLAPDIGSRGVRER